MITNVRRKHVQKWKRPTLGYIFAPVIKNHKIVRPLIICSTVWIMPLVHSTTKRISKTDFKLKNHHINICRALWDVSTESFLTPSSIIKRISLNSKDQNTYARDLLNLQNHSKWWATTYSSFLMMSWNKFEMKKC